MSDKLFAEGVDDILTPSHGGTIMIKARGNRIRIDGDAMEGRNSWFGFVRAIAALAVFVCAAVSCPAAQPASITVIATLFPQYDFARQIAGGKAEVRLLLPPGTESHSFEPTPGDMKAIAGADLFIYTGPHMEPWAKRLADSAALPDGAAIVDASDGVHLSRHGMDEAHEHEGEHEDGAHVHEFDPHIWTDPLLAAAMADNIAKALAERDPENAGEYLENGRRLRAELEAMDAGFRKIVEAGSRRTLVFGERFAFAYFFSRYGLKEVGAYASCAPGVEPGLKAVLGVVRYVKDNGVRYIYREAGSVGRISGVIQEESGVEILVVDSLHNPPPERTGGKNFQDMMRENMAAFAKGLE